MHTTSSASSSSSQSTLDSAWPAASADGCGPQFTTITVPARAGAAVLFSSHQLDLVEDLCPQVVVIDRGRVVLAGAIEELRAASPHRYLDVSTGGPPADWESLIPGARVVANLGNRLRVLLPDGADLVKLAEIARTVGPVTEFSFKPPDLSEVFRETVRS